MDAFDYAILKQLQRDSRVSTDKLGALVGLSASACQRRIKNLKAEGVINRHVALLNREKLDGYTTVILDVVLEKGGEQSLDDFISQVSNENRVQQVYYTAGEVDFVMIVVVKDMREFDRLTRKLLMANANVKKFHSRVVIDSVKLGLDVPL